MEEKGKWTYSYPCTHCFTYASWKEFHTYRPYTLEQWKQSILFWWSVNDTEYTLVYMPKSSDKRISLQDSPHFTVTIQRSQHDSEEEIRAWLFSMRPEMWRLEN
jgi:hypothetical protein